MTVEVFKVWFSAFVESIGGTPNDAEWRVLKEKIKQLKEIK